MIKRFLAYWRLNLNAVCELSKHLPPHRDYHDYKDSEVGEPWHFYIHTCKRCGKGFFIALATFLLLAQYQANAKCKVYEPMFTTCVPPLEEKCSTGDIAYCTHVPGKCTPPTPTTICDSPEELTNVQKYNPTALTPSADVFKAIK